MSEGPKEYRRNVAAVVVDAEGRVLLGRKNATSRFLHFPQGGVGHKETFEQALWRELAEETGLTSQHLQIVARVGGLCYHYRKKNKKSKIWVGQQQTYYLLRCTQAYVAADATRSAEFSSLEWVPFRELSPELFVSFKREVAEEVLELFFPRRVEDLAAYWQQLNVASRYEFGPDSALAAFSAQERSLFLGGKEEARPALEDLRKRIRAAQRKWKACQTRRAYLCSSRMVSRYPVKEALIACGMRQICRIRSISACCILLLTPARIKLRIKFLPQICCLRPLHAC